MPDPVAKGSSGRQRTVVKKLSTSKPRGSLPIAPQGGALRGLKTSESVARDIVHDIVTAGLQDGDGLPSEAAMLQQYGVSRESLREGLRLLEVQGLIRIRRGPGGGPIVGSLDPANMGRTSTLYFHLAGATYAELFDAWVISEGTIVELAARNPDRDAIRAAMAPYLEDDEHAHDDENLAEFVTKHTQFHLAIGNLARNKVLQLTLMAIGEIIVHHVVMNADPRDARITIEHDHRAIAQALSAGHAKKAVGLMHDHIRNVTNFYRGDLGPQMDDFIDWR